jgi:hypothetical protein
MAPFTTDTPMPKREVRLQPRPDKFVGGKWTYTTRRVSEVISDKWVMVRNADFPNAVPFVVSKKDWEKFERE